MENNTLKNFCAVPGCYNAENSSSDVHFFPFPLDINRCLKWLLMCNRKDFASNMVTDLNKTNKICSIHFSSKCFVKNHKTLLKATAIPTLNLPRKQFTLNERINNTGTIINCSFLQEDISNSNHQIGKNIKEKILTTNDTSTFINILCRLCLDGNVGSDNMINIFDTTGISEQIHACLPIQVSTTDLLPKYICFNCQKTLREHYKFHQTVIESENILREMFGSGADAKEENCFDVSSNVELTDTISHTDHIYVDLANDNDMENIHLFSEDISENVIIESGEQLLENTDRDEKTNVEIINIDKSTSSDVVLYVFDFDKKSLSFLDNLDRSNVEISDNIKHACVLCNLSEFTNEEDLLEHMNLHSTSDEQQSNILEPHKTLDVSSEKNSVNIPSEMWNVSNKTFKCSLCGKKFKSKHRIEFHLKLHMNDSPGFCEICEKHFADENLLYRHTWYLHNGGRAKRALSSAQKGSTIHSKVLKGDGESETCVVCRKAFVKVFTRLSHEEEVHGIVRYCYRCCHCMEAFSSLSQLQNHTKEDHNAQFVRAEKKDLQRTKIQHLYQCEYCSRLYTNASYLNVHRKHNHSRCVNTCSICFENFLNHEDLLKHLSSCSQELHHTDKDDKPIARRYFSCPHCSKSFQVLNNMLVHSSRCKESSSPSKKKNLSQSAKTHENNQNESCELYTCDVCPKSFSSETSLFKHNMVHTGEKPYVCDFCGKSFRQSSGLTTHTKIHSDERPFSCTHCDKTFKIKTELANHKRNHSGDRPFECGTCHKTFMTQHVFSQHCRIHTDYRPYSCEICGYAFRRSHVLKVHMLRHFNQKPHACFMCDKKYRQRGDLLKHCKAQHGVTTCPPTKLKPMR